MEDVQATADARSVDSVGQFSIQMTLTSPFHCATWPLCLMAPRGTHAMLAGSLAPLQTPQGESYSFFLLYSLWPHLT